MKKYILENFLEKIKNLTPIQSVKKNYQRHSKFQEKQNYQILNETKSLYNKKSHFTKIQIKEFSVLFLMYNYLDVASKKLKRFQK